MTTGLIIFLIYLAIAFLVDRFFMRRGGRDEEDLKNQQFYKETALEFGEERAWKIANMTRNLLIIFWPITLILFLINKLKDKKNEEKAINN